MKSSTYFRIFGFAVALSLCGYAGPASKAGSPDAMTDMKLSGLTVRLGSPLLVNAQIGWGMEWPRPAKEGSWSFIHLTPTVERFPGGNIIATYALDPDTRENQVCLSGFQISKDGGRHWGRRYSVLMRHDPMIFLPQENDSLLALPSEFMPSSEDPHTLIGTAYLFEQGGDRMVSVPNRVKIVDWHWPAGFLPDSGPRGVWISQVTLMGSTIREGKTILATGYGPVPPWTSTSHRFDSLLFASEDGGATWKRYATIAPYDESLAGQDHYQGPNETTMIRLADGDLMAVFRVGGGRNWNLRRNYSHDGGRTWSRPDVLPALSVRPVLRRLENGTIALATGRPGVYLWLATDPRALHWQKVDVIANHKARAPELSQPIGPHPLAGIETGETAAYISMVETSPNHLLLVYDPERLPSGPQDLSRVYVLPVEIARN